MSNFIVSARKYRPIRFDEVVGQQHVSQTLKNALQNDHLAHAFLFCGPRGVGKTTCARILAKVLNCQNITKDFEPCDNCNSCTAFNENASFNIVELDAASHNSVEHIRALIEQVRFQPQQGKYKIFIIDEVHMLSQSAFNAFLKTLEEPPPYAIFILATTEKHKIIPTILSRCQIFDFRRIQVPDMISHLQDICKQENIKADADALHIIAQKADGALRDSLSIFDRVVSFSGDKITYEDVITNLNVLDYDYFFKIVDAMLVEDLPNVLLLFDDIQRKGFEANIFINGLADHIRNLLVCQNEQTISLLEVSDGLKERYKEQAQISSASFLLTALNLANECDVNYKMAQNKRLHVEMSIIKMTYISRVLKAPKTIAASLTPTPNVTPVEKKTPDINPKPFVPIKPSSSVNNIVEEEAIPLQRKESNKINPNTQKDKIPSLGTKSKHLISKIPSLAALQEEVTNSGNQEEEKETVLTQEAVQNAWSAYAASVSSPSVKTTLNKTEISIGKNKIIATIGTRIGKELIQQEHELMPAIRKRLGLRKLAMEIVIDSSKAPEVEAPKTKTLLTGKEKFQKMIEVNPLVDDLRERLDLRLDNS